MLINEGEFVTGNPDELRKYFHENFDFPIDPYGISKSSRIRDARWIKKFKPHLIVLGKNLMSIKGASFNWEGRVKLKNKTATKLPINFTIMEVPFTVELSNIKTMEGFPSKVEKKFRFSNNNFPVLEKFKMEVDEFEWTGNKTSTIKNVHIKSSTINVRGNLFTDLSFLNPEYFDPSEARKICVSWNPIKNFEGFTLWKNFQDTSPHRTKMIEAEFVKLDNLLGLPETLNFTVSIGDSKIYSLKGLPKSVIGDKKIHFLDGCEFGDISEFDYIALDALPFINFPTYFKELIDCKNDFGLSTINHALVLHFESKNLIEYFEKPSNFEQIKKEIEHLVHANDYGLF